MRYVLTNRQMREADEYTIKEKGVPSLLLMERAGVALADEAELIMPQGKITCVCGGGNNGGDGFVCARVLKNRGREVDVVFFAEKQSFDCGVNMEKWMAIGGKISKELKKDCALVVDCLYGTGFKGALMGADMDIALWINERKKSGLKVLCADMPSGLNGENGRAEGVVVQADVTLCIGEIKLGALLNDGLDFAGEIKCVDIGISLPSSNYARWIGEREAKALLPKRKRNSHKGSYGKVAIVGGSDKYVGAPYLSASSALRAGTGYVVLFAPKSLLPYYYLKSPEMLIKSIGDGDRYVFNEENMRTLLGYDAIAYGMGMDVTEEVAKGATWLLENYEGKLVLDADGLNALSYYEKTGYVQALKNAKCDVILTPHCKEFSRLIGVEVGQVLNESLSLVKEFSRSLGVSILLKNATTIICDGENTALNTRGCSGLAKAGSGDVLSGIIASLCAQGTSTYDGGVLGAYLLGRSAELVKEDLGGYSLTATDVILYLGRAFLSLEREE